MSATPYAAICKASWNPIFLMSSLEDITDLVLRTDPEVATEALARLSGCCSVL